VSGKEERDDLVPDHLPGEVPATHDGEEHDTKVARPPLGAGIGCGAPRGGADTAAVALGEEGVDEAVLPCLGGGEPPVGRAEPASPGGVRAPPGASEHRRGRRRR
jgi:hypothetical protein